jgi:hypothetical protein
LIAGAFVTAALITIPAALGSPSRSHGTRIIYYIPFGPPVDMHNIVVRVGENVNSKKYSYCWPTPKPGRFCGGALNRGTKDPSGGNPRDHYTFTVRRGFVPLGLALHFKNGWLTGTVRPQLNRVWRFHVCVDQGAFTKATCAPASISVIGAYDGNWTGTITGTETVNGDGSEYTQTYSDTFFLTVANSTLTFDANVGGAQAKIDSHGDATASYGLNVYWNNGDVSEFPCTFNMHFTYAGTGSGSGPNGQPVSCQGTNPNDGETATFTNGTVTLTRTG